MRGVSCAPGRTAFARTSGANSLERLDVLRPLDPVERRSLELVEPTRVTDRGVVRGRGRDLVGVRAGDPAVRRESVFGRHDAVDLDDGVGHRLQGVMQGERVRWNTELAEETHVGRT